MSPHINPLYGMYFNIINISPAIIEIVYISVLVIGIVMVCKDKSLSRISKCVWILLIVVLNIIGLLFFIVWRKRSVNIN